MKEGVTKPVHLALIAIILLTLPCYCLGFVALTYLNSVNRVDPTPVPTVVTNTPTQEYSPAPPTTTLGPTPTQWFPPTDTPDPTHTLTPTFTPLPTNPKLNSTPPKCR